MPTFAAKPLEQLTATVFEHCGAPPENARAVAEHLVASNLAGHDSHGVMRIPQYVASIEAGRLKPEGRMRIVQQAAASAVVDGGAGFGQVIGREAMALAIELACVGGVGAVTVRNSGHTGRIGTYTAQAADAGLVGIVTINASGGGQSVAPFGGRARRLGTNQISIGAPSGGREPILLDIATSTALEGKVRTMLQAEKSLPAGWLIDAAGNPTTDPADFYREPGGAILPLGGPLGYKGFGLAFMIDILTGALSGAGCCRANPPEPIDAMLAIALDVQQFTPLADFTQHVAQLVAHVKSCPTAPSFEQIYVPGEIEARERQRRLRDGIYIEPGTWEPIAQICQRFGIGAPAGT